MSEEINVDELLKRILEEEEYVKSQSLNYQEYLPEFISKAQEDLEIIESGAIELEKDIDNQEIVNAMFRSFHNIKGSSGFVGQNTIQKVAHQTETMLDGCRKGTNRVTKKLIDLVLRSADFIRQICENTEFNDDAAFLEEVVEHVKELEEEDNGSIEAIIEGASDKTESPNNEFFEDFVLEAADHIETMEANLLKLEKTPENMEIIHELFRDFHSVKGLAGFAGQVVVQRVSHAAETLLDRYRKETCAIEPENTELLLETVTILRKLCSTPETSTTQDFLELICGHIQKLESEESVIEDRSQAEGAVDDEFLQDFILETGEHIEAIEMNIIVLESEPDNEEKIHSLFRSFHTIKGLAGFVEQTLIEKIAHQTETVLDKCRKKELSINKSIVDIILASSDYIKKICEDISIARDKGFLTEVNKHLKNIEESSASKCPKIGELLVSEKKMRPEEVEEIIAKQKSDYPDLKFGQVAVKEKKAQPKDILDSVRNQKTGRSSAGMEDYMRISTGKVDNLVDMVGELVIIQSLIEQQALAKLGDDTYFLTNFGRMARITKDLQNLAMYLRMVPLKSTFQKITRIARDTINELGKDIEFSTSGDDTEIDRIVTEKLLDPLVHLVKNAVSHGIEPTEERIKAGKPERGYITVSAYNKRGNIYIEIKDDGGGINIEKVYKKAVEKGLIDQNREYSEKEIQEFIMLPGFSTVEVANNISGRGVGMDVVRTEIQKNGGKVDIYSEKGKGTTFVMKIPVNHAILNGTVVDIEGSNYILPTVNVKQIVQPTEDSWVYTQNKRSMIKVRGDIIPLIPIKKIFSSKKTEEPYLVVVLELESRYMALPVRNVIGRQEIVVKPAGKEFAHLDFIAGMSILGDGKVSLILDVENMFKSTEGVR